MCVQECQWHNPLAYDWNLRKLRYMRSSNQYSKKCYHQYTLHYRNDPSSKVPETLKFPSPNSRYALQARIQRSHLHLHHLEAEAGCTYHLLENWWGVNFTKWWITRKIGKIVSRDECLTDRGRFLENARGLKASLSSPSCPCEKQIRLYLEPWNPLPVAWHLLFPRWCYRQ